MKGRVEIGKQKADKDRALILLSALCFLLSSCRQAGNEKPEATSLQPSRDYLNLMSGVVVVDRSGELYLQTSAIHAIDGMPNSIWTSPPADPHQRLTVAFPALTRITHVGVSTGQLAVKGRAVSQLVVESSANGSDFHPLTTLDLNGAADDQLFEIRPTDALAVRASIQKTIANADASDLPELLIRGTELEPVVRPSLTGSWKLNNLTASLLSLEGDRVLGRVEMNPPLLLDGAWNGRWVEFAWARGPQYGIGALVVSRDRSKLNGLYWFQQAIPQFLADPWFGDRLSDSNTALNPLAVARNLLERGKTYPIYQLRFDATNRLTPESLPSMLVMKELISEFAGSRFRITAHEYGRRLAEDDLRATREQIASLRDVMGRNGIDLSRFTFVPAGRKFMHPDPLLPHYHRLHSRIDLEVIEKD